MKRKAGSGYGPDGPSGSPQTLNARVWRIRTLKARRTLGLKRTTPPQSFGAGSSRIGTGAVIGKLQFSEPPGGFAVKAGTTNDGSQ